MRDEGGRLVVPGQPILDSLQRAWVRICSWRFGGAQLGARFALLVYGLTAITAARTLTFTHSVSDRDLPPIPPLIWLFHLADLLFVPGSAQLPGIGAVQAVQMVALVLSLVLFYLAVRSTVPALLLRHYRPLAYGAVGLAGLLSLLSLQGILPYPLALGRQHYGNDAVGVTICATDRWLKGENPYVSVNAIQCLNENDMPSFKTTPLQAGAFATIRGYPSRQQLDQAYSTVLRSGWKHPKEFESWFSYPAASFLIPAVYVAAHLHDLSVLYVLCYLVLVGVIVWRAPGRTARRFALIAVAANAALWPTVISGNTDAQYTLLILLAWAGRRHRWPSALALGLAVASRQPAWFYLLFYAVLIGKTEGRRELLWRLGIVLGVAGLTNLPYLIASPGPWLAGVLGPMRDPMFPRGTGLISLSALSNGTLGAVPLGPRGLYSLLEALGLLASLALYWRTCRAHPGTGLVLAPVALFFAWRSLYSYFLPISLLALYPALVECARPRETDVAPEHRPQGQPPAEVAA